MYAKCIRLGGAFVFVTRRCSERRFFLKPGKRANQGFKYCLARAVRNTGVKVLFSAVMSNHYHLGLYDPNGNLPRFMRELNRLVSKHHNTLYGRRDPLFDDKGYSYQYLPTYEDLLDKAAYTLANPVRAGLVEKAEDWPGVMSLQEDLGRSEVVKRPETYFRDIRKTCPEELVLEYHVPKGFEGGAAAWRRKVKEPLKRLEVRAQKEREGKGWNVAGAKRVLSQHHESRPKTKERWFKLNPRVAARDLLLRVQEIRALKAFRAKYREALERWCRGEHHVEFPAGTYWMRVHHGACCAAAAAT